MTFRELYLKEKSKPKFSPGQIFIMNVAQITKKSENTVRQWISGVAIPDALTVDVLSKHFKCDPAMLFPVKTSKQAAR